MKRKQNREKLKITLKFDDVTEYDDYIRKESEDAFIASLPNNKLDKKYEINGNIKKIRNNITLKQIRALKDFGDVKKGDIGGWIESESNLSQNGNCWIYGDAWVSGNAKVSEDVWVYGDAWVFGNAKVSGYAKVSGDAKIYGDASVNNGFINN